MRPTLFIGSSVEGLPLARNVQLQLQDVAEVTVWDQGVFPLGGGALESLVNALDRFDFAVLVVTPDDRTVLRGVERLSARDNVLFELGLFMGRLGRSRTFVLRARTAALQLPSDLAGVTVAVYDDDRQDRNLLAAVGPACTTIRHAIVSTGPFEGRVAQRMSQAAGDVEALTIRMARLTELLARSRQVKLELITKRFGGFLSSDAMDELVRDLEAFRAEGAPPDA